MRKRCFAARSGFTLIEMVAVMVILFALTITAVTKFDMSSTEIDAVARMLRSNLQLAQDMAMTQGTTFGFRPLLRTTYEIYDGAPGTPAKDPLTQGNFIVDISPVSFSSVSGVAFGPDGKPDSTTNVSIGLRDSDGRTKFVVVQRNTGFVRILSLSPGPVLPVSPISP